jgi:putative DNA primase/helicase
MANNTAASQATNNALASQAPDFSEEAIALAFVDSYADELRHVAPWGRWLRWNGSHWGVDETYEIFALVRGICRKFAMHATGKLARDIASARTVAAVEKLARADRRVAAEVQQWDADPWLLNTPGGVVDLRTGKMRRHRREDYFTKITAVAPGKGCKLFEKFLRRIFDDDRALIRYMQRVFGYALTGKNNEHALFFGYGTGANGKSVLIEAMRGILGDYHQTAALQTFVVSASEQHPTDLAMLRGARLVTCTETESGTRWAETKIKTLTGGDEIQARFMRQDFFKFTPQFKLLVAGNHKPQLRAVNEAIRRRVNLIPFSVTIPVAERDKKLGEKLKREWSGILNWMIKGCLEWQRIGLRPPQAVIDATEDYLAGEDVVGMFIEDECEKDANSEVERTVLYLQWKFWSSENNVFTGAAKLFYGWVEERGFIMGRDSSGDHRVFKGLRLKQVTHSKKLHVVA